MVARTCPSSDIASKFERIGEAPMIIQANNGRDRCPAPLHRTLSRASRCARGDTFTIIAGDEVKGRTYRDKLYWLLVGGGHCPTAT